MITLQLLCRLAYVMSAEQVAWINSKIAIPEVSTIDDDDDEESKADEELAARRVAEAADVSEKVKRANSTVYLNMTLLRLQAGHTCTQSMKEKERVAKEEERGLTKTKTMLSSNLHFERLVLFLT